MIRAVLDTNVLISSVIGTGAPREIVVAGRRGAFDIVTSPSIIEELRRAMVVKLRLDGGDVDRIAYALARVSDVVAVFEASARWCDDRADDAIIETAIRSGAEYLVTGDRRLLACRIGALEIVEPVAFLALLEATREQRPATARATRSASTFAAPSRRVLRRGPGTRAGAGC